MPTHLTSDDTRARLIGALPHLADTEIEAVSHLVCRQLPAWVDEYGIARAAESYWLWLAAPDAQLPPDMGQAGPNLPPGRYVVEAHDVERHGWIAQETAAAPPLVVGVPRRAGAVILRLSRAGP